MKSLSFFLMTVLAVSVASVATAQVLPDVGVDTVRSGIGEEGLAPVVIKQPPRPAVSVTAVPAVGVSATDALVVADPFVVKGVVATLSGTTGFDRDAALEVAARQALPGVLVSMGHTPEKAAKAVKGVGSAMKFVKGFKVVKETLIPTYTLTTDMTFNGPMIQKNFGGKLPSAEPLADKSSVILKVSGTENLPVDGVDVGVPVAASAPVRQLVVRVVDRDPAAVDKVRQNLIKQAGTRATYRLVTSAGAELLVDTPLAAADISRYAGHEVQVMELEIPLPTTVVPEGSSHPWQGQSEPSVPSAPNAPRAPGAPEGTY